MVVAMELTADQAELFPVLDTRAKAKPKSLLRQSMDAFTEHGALLPQSFLASILGISKQRVSQLIQAGKLATVELDGHTFVPMAALEIYLSQDRDEGGRPHKFGTVEQLRALAGLKL